MLETSHSAPPPLPSDRKFGGFFASVFALLALYALWKDHTTRAAILAILSGLFALTALVAPAVLAPLNRLWMAFGLLLGKFISPIVLGIIFMVLITPVALATRLFGRDALRMKKSSAASYWIERDPAGPEPASFQRQF
ncbi:MAG: hypothetical protein RL274_453 [Pseudomonadota bacterium]|jgi:predicted membrane metal-binding protein